MNNADITKLLSASEKGDQHAHEQLFGLIYEELHRLARGRGRGVGETLRPTVLVNEAYLKLMGGSATFENRSKFFAHAALAMRQIVLNAAEKAKAQKRGGGCLQFTFQDWDAASEGSADMSSLNEALEFLEKIKPRWVQIISLHYFAGFKIHEIAEIMELSESTIYQDLNIAKAWLKKKLDDET